jgi:hypothetical protein
MTWQKNFNTRRPLSSAAMSKRFGNLCVQKWVSLQDDKGEGCFWRDETPFSRTTKNVSGDKSLKITAFKRYFFD